MYNNCLFEKILVKDIKTNQAKRNAIVLLLKLLLFIVAKGTKTKAFKSCVKCRLFDNYIRSQIIIIFFSSIIFFSFYF